MTKNAMTINNLTDTEFDTFVAMTDKALGDFFDGICWSKAYQNVVRWCARRGITEEAMYAWLDD